MSTSLIRLARSGDEAAFRELADAYRAELHVHCYRMLGSVQDAEDALQETLVAAWRGLASFQERASVRTWLYRIATNRCLNMLRSARRQPANAPFPPGIDLPEPTRLGEVTWLEPYPDAWLPGGGADTAPGPAARYEAKETISLAFVTAIQLLPARQRAVLILRDVLDFPAAEVARLLDTTEQSVTSALKRARATLRNNSPADRTPPPAPDSAAERELVGRFTTALESGDVDGLVSLLADDVRLAMPPMPLEYQGRDLAARFHAALTFRDGRTYRVVPTRANGQLAFGVYLVTPAQPVAQANGLMVLTLAGDTITAMTRFEPTVFGAFGLPSTLPPGLV
ncbi:sigma-70 family RNA polymerase sigma factor [Amycolatopsis sp. K13G38]|uniref:Sigma-70 family RNA polymerase sigma factor n=1 Tax=Amycolatopsis acididurans TaxID=2724524 RepID=A0ABX1JK49_9PSEU|nr:sigma-70 family RNA polymerase sigma factor [Amycolatopsis acididurans]NKQ58627.1 sigma-70 family RNA polymerase sigma factor [Amycolatopsis acididurans]